MDSVTVWLVLAAVAVVVLAAFFMSEIKVEASLKRKNDDDMIRISVVALYGLLRRQMVIPMLMWEGDGVKVKWKMEKGGEAAAEGQQAARPRTVNIDQKKVKRAYRNFVLLLEATFHLKKWMAATIRNVRCRELVWGTRIGLGDAAASAIAAGVIWSVKAPVIGWFTNLVRMQTMPQLSVVPQFNETNFETVFRGQFHIRVAAALVSLVYLVWRVLRVRGGIRRWWELAMDMRARSRRKRMKERRREKRAEKHAKQRAEQ